MIYPPQSVRDSHQLDGVTPALSLINELQTRLKIITVSSHTHASNLQGVAQRLATSTSAATTAIENRLLLQQMPGANALTESFRSGAQTLAEYARSLSEISHAQGFNQFRGEAALFRVRFAMQWVEQIMLLLSRTIALDWQHPPQIDHVPESSTEPDHYNYPMTIPFSPQLPFALRMWQQALESIQRCREEAHRLREKLTQADEQLAKNLRATPVGAVLSHAGSTEDNVRYAIAGAFSGQIWGSIISFPQPSPTLTPTHQATLALLLAGKPGHAVWDDPPSAKHVSQTWNTLSAAQKLILSFRYPEVIGNLAGISAKDRDAANRLQLQRLSLNPAALTPTQLEFIASLNQVLQSKQPVKAGDNSDNLSAPLHLLSLDSTNEIPRASVSYGDTDTATNVTVMVGGMGTDAPSALPGAADTAAVLFRSQQKSILSTESHAVIAWLGYDSPDLITVLGSESAQTGAPKLTADLDALWVQSADPTPFKQVHVVAHSYGTTLASIALTKLDHPVSTFTMLGSAGLDTELVPDLLSLQVSEIVPGQRAIFTSIAQGDILAPQGAALSGRSLPQRNNTMVPGALEFSVEGDPALKLKDTNGHALRGSSKMFATQGFYAEPGHGYFDPGTQSLHTVTQITTHALSGATIASFCRVSKQNTSSRSKRNQNPLKAQKPRNCTADAD